MELFQYLNLFKGKEKKELIFIFDYLREHHKYTLNEMKKKIKKMFYIHLDFAVNFPLEANGFATRSEQFACESPNIEYVL